MQITYDGMYSSFQTLTATRFLSRLPVAHHLHSSMILDSYGSLKVIKGRLGRVEKGSDHPGKKKPINSAIFKTLFILHLQGENYATVQASPRTWAIASDFVSYKLLKTVDLSSILLAQIPIVLIS